MGTNRSRQAVQSATSSESEAGPRQRPQRSGGGYTRSKAAPTKARPKAAKSRKARFDQARSELSDGREKRVTRQDLPAFPRGHGKVVYLSEGGKVNAGACRLLKTTGAYGGACAVRRARKGTARDLSRGPDLGLEPALEHCVERFIHISGQRALGKGDDLLLVKALALHKEPRAHLPRPALLDRDDQVRKAAESVLGVALGGPGVVVRVKSGTRRSHPFPAAGRSGPPG